MCEETDIESVLAAMNTTALVFERRPAKKFQAPRDLNPTITWSLHVPAISINISRQSAIVRLPH